MHFRSFNFCLDFLWMSLPPGSQSAKPNKACWGDVAGPSIASDKPAMLSCATESWAKASGWKGRLKEPWLKLIYCGLCDPNLRVLLKHVSLCYVELLKNLRSSSSAHTRSTGGSNTLHATGKGTSLIPTMVDANAWIAHSSPRALASASEAATPAAKVASNTSTAASLGWRNAEKLEPTSASEKKRSVSNRTGEIYRFSPTSFI